MSKQTNAIHPASYEGGNGKDDDENNNNFDCGKIERLDALEFLLDSSSGLIVVATIVGYYCSNIVNRSENVFLTFLCRWLSNNEFTYNTVTGNVVGSEDGVINPTYSTILILCEVIVAVFVIFLLYKLLVQRSQEEKFLKCARNKKNRQ
jgi:uncharacterized membrane protein YozB (DUF420 family)